MRHKPAKPFLFLTFNPRKIFVGISHNLAQSPAVLAFCSTDGSKPHFLFVTTILPYFGMPHGKPTAPPAVL